MEETMTEHTEPVAQPAPSVGAILREAREARSLSVEEIAARVRFSVRQVEALERDDMEHLPQGTFLRGFIRSYARVLGLDEEKLLQATHTRTEHHFDVGDVQDGGTPLPVVGASLMRSRYLLLLALLVACVLLVFVWMQGQSVTVSAVPEAMPAESSPVAASAVVEVPVAVADPVEAVRETAVKTVESPKPVVMTKPAEAVIAKSKTGSIEEAAEQPPKPVLPLEQLRKRPIHIVFVEEAWMEIKDVNGEVLLSRITPAGDEKWVGGGNRAPYQITIGKAGAVRMYYHGKQVDLSRFNPAGVAKLVLE
jgi:cytoskeleton protein RodZ